MNEPPISPVWDQILATLAECWAPKQWADVGVVIACSGGADSVALLRAVTQLRTQQSDASGFLIAAHFNHALREEESDGDEAFVRQLAQQLGIPAETERGDGNASDEATLRDQRHQFLLSTAKKRGARYVAVAHTIDDNVETVLHHLMRGTGPRGIAGIAPKRSLADDFVLVRPLLSVKRDRLRQGLREIGQSWREDSSNANTDYSRNWIRSVLIPMIESQYPQAVNAVGRAIDGQWQWRETIDQQAEAWLSEHLISGTGITLSRDSKSDMAIVVAALQLLWDQKNWPRQEMSRPHWTRLATTILGHDPERYSLPSAMDVSADRDHVRIIESKSGLLR